jgi:hypothetical protein
MFLYQINFKKRLRIVFLIIIAPNVYAFPYNFDDVTYA